LKYPIKEEYCQLTLLILTAYPHFFYPTLFGKILPATALVVLFSSPEVVLDLLFALPYKLLL